MTNKKEKSTVSNPETIQPVSAHTLTDEQRAVVLDTENHVLVEAGAGSGKTTVLISKLLYELGYQDVDGSSAPRRISLESIGAITFTRKAAGEIKERLRGEIMKRALSAPTGIEREKWLERAFAIDQAHIGTIDAFAGKLIRDYGPIAGIEAGFEILDPGDASALYVSVAEQELLSGVASGDAGAQFLVTHFGFFRSREVIIDMLSRGDILTEVLAKRSEGDLDWKKVLKTKITASDLILNQKSGEILDFMARAHQVLKASMEEQGVLDHAHVLLRAAELAKNEDVQRAFRRDLNLLLVDEHQDTSLAQVELLFHLAGIPAPIETSAVEEAEKTDGEVQEETECENIPPLRLLLVGDPKQGIYSFRGADITMWDYSRRALEAVGGREYLLQKNHRSRPSLLRFFDSLLDPIMVPEKEERQSYEINYRSLVPAREESDGPAAEFLLTHYKSSVADSADLIAHRISYMLSNPSEFPVHERNPETGVEEPRPIRARDIAILSRNLKGVAEEYERALAKYDIGSYLYGGSGLYGREEIQDVAMLMKVIADPRDPFSLTAFLRSPLGGVDDVGLLALSNHATSIASIEGENSLYKALTKCEDLEGLSSDQKSQLARALRIIRTLRSLRDRIPHHALMERALDITGYRSFLAGAPDSPAGLRNIEKLLRIARRSANEPLFQFVRNLEAKVRRADPEEEAPLYSPDDDLVTISTIHKAKGLEWPYVVIAGVNKNMFHPVSDSTPGLSREMGVVLPISLVVEEDSGRTESVTETSAAWNRYVESATKELYAESQRLLYVGATRARERIIFAGNAYKSKKKEVRSEKITGLHKQAIEQWLRYVFPKIGEAKEVTYGDQQEVARVYREAGDFEDSITMKKQESRGKNVLHSWPSPPSPEVLSKVKARPQSPLIAQRTGSVEKSATVKDEFTASELMMYERCMWKHFYGYRKSVSTPSLELGLDYELVNQITPELRGEILHEFFLDFDENWSEEQKHAEMMRILLRFLPLGEEDAIENASRLLEYANNYLGSDTYKRVKESSEVFEELPFVFEIEPGLRLRGVIDVLFCDGSGEWDIIDFKTGLFGSGSRSRHQMDTELAKRIEHYEIQAAVYALAASELLSKHNNADIMVKKFNFFFTAVGECKEVVVTEEWLEEWRGKIAELIELVRAGEYVAPPVWEKEKCANCDFIRLCRPEGVPPEELEAAASSSESGDETEGRGGIIDRRPGVFRLPVLSEGERETPA